MFPCMKLGDDCMKICTDLTGDLTTVFHTTLIADGLRDSELDMSVLKMVIIQVI